jgi:hypothetical protein
MGNESSKYGGWDSTLTNIQLGSSKHFLHYLKTKKKTIKQFDNWDESSKRQFLMEYLKILAPWKHMVTETFSVSYSDTPEKRDYFNLYKEFLIQHGKPTDFNKYLKRWGFKKNNIFNRYDSFIRQLPSYRELLLIRYYNILISHCTNEWECLITEILNQSYDDSTERHNQIKTCKEFLILHDTISDFSNYLKKFSHYLDYLQNNLKTHRRYLREFMADAPYNQEKKLIEYCKLIKAEARQ